MSLFRRATSPNWYTLVRWRGYPRLYLSTGTPNKGRAVAIERTLFALRGNGRRDILEMLADGRLRPPDVHESYMQDPAALEQRVQAVASPTLGPLVDDWLAWLRSPGVLSPKTRRPYAPPPSSATVRELDPPVSGPAPRPRWHAERTSPGDSWPTTASPGSGEDARAPRSTVTSAPCRRSSPGSRRSGRWMSPGPASATRRSRPAGSGGCPPTSYGASWGPSRRPGARSSP